MDWLNEILDEADQAVKDWPEWMQLPEYRLKWGGADG